MKMPVRGIEMLIGPIFLFSYPLIIDHLSKEFRLVMKKHYFWALRNIFPLHQRTYYFENATNSCYVCTFA